MTDALTAYVPQLVQRQLAGRRGTQTGPFADSVPAAALFVDISGSTALSERLAARSSAGAVNYVPIAQVECLAELVRDLQAHDVRVVVASEKADCLALTFDFRNPAALIIGSEGRGVSEELQRLCDATVAIPQSGRVGSLNAAVAAGILLYEVRRQRTCQ